MEISLQSNIKQVTRSLSGIQRKVIIPATNAALNKTVTTIAKEVRSQVAKDTGLKVGEVKERMRIQRSSFRTLASIIHMRGRWFNLIRFNAKQTKKGVTSKAWGKRKLYRGAFIANKGRTVFKREGKERLPIKAMPGPNPVVELEKRIDIHQSSAIKRFNQVFPRELEFRLAKLN